jgi:hypothetical protein
LSEVFSEASRQVSLALFLSLSLPKENIVLTHFSPCHPLQWKALVWVAQGSYFASSTRLYAELASITEEEATNVLSGTFASWYLSLEMLVKVAASAILYIDIRNAEVTVVNHF